VTGAEVLITACTVDADSTNTLILGRAESETKFATTIGIP
jgi:hypothetical protein